MGAARHMWWKILGLAAVWPAWTVTRTFLWHPRSASDIGDVLACLTAILITLTAARHRGSVPSLAAWWRKREIGRLKAQLAQHEAEAAARFTELDDRIAGLFEGLTRIASVTGRPIPPCVAADAPTQPIYLRDRRKAI